MSDRTHVHTLNGPVYIDGLDKPGNYKVGEIKMKKRQDRVWYEISVSVTPVVPIECIKLDVVLDEKK